MKRKLPVKKIDGTWAEVEITGDPLSKSEIYKAMREITEKTGYIFSTETEKGTYLSFKLPVRLTESDPKIIVISSHIGNL